MIEIIRKKKIRELIKKKGFRVGNQVIIKLSSKIEENIERYIQKAMRNASISGRKTLIGEDIED